MTASVAVIIPSHDRRHCLGRALDSVLAQTLAPTEICVVDDGSSDGTAEYLHRDYPQVRCHHQPNQGVSAARNAGVRHSSSEWLAFLDSDDEWLPHKLERQLADLAANPDYRLGHCEEIWIRNGVRVNPMRKHQKAGGNIFKRCLPLCAISPSAAVIQRSLLDEMGGFDESLPACEDYDLWLRICARYPVRFLDETLLRKFGGHEDQLSRRYQAMDRFRVQALDKLLRQAQLDPEQRRLAQAELLKKCSILLGGARKRQRQDRVEHYQALMASYGDHQQETAT